MKKLQIDVLGKSPSLAEIEKYNMCQNNKIAIMLIFSWLFFIFIIPFDVLFRPELEVFVPVYFLSVILGVFFLFFAIYEISRKEYWVSSDVYINLIELTNKYPEFASYRDQVIAQGRRLLVSEYKACKNILEARAELEFYKVKDVN